MKQFTFAFIVMSPDHDSNIHNAVMESPMCKSIMIGVKDLDDACVQAKKLVDAGTIKKIELCGAFGKEGAQVVRDAVGDSVIVSYIVNLE